MRRGLDYRTIQYFKNTLKVTQMADFMNQDTNTRFTRREWRQFVSRMERESTGKTPDNYKVAEMGDAIYYAGKNIPREARYELRITITPNIEDGARVYLERGGASIPAISLSTTIKLGWSTSTEWVSTTRENKRPNTDSSRYVRR